MSELMDGNNGGHLVSSSQSMDESSTDHMQQYIIQEIVVQNDLNSQIVGKPDTTDQDMIFSADDSQSSVLFQTVGEDVVYGDNNGACGLSDASESQTIYLQDSNVVQGIGLHGEHALVNQLQVNDLILHNESSSENVLLENVDGHLIQNVDGSIIQNTDGSLIQNTDGGFVQNVDGNLIQHVDGNFIQHTDGGSLVQNIDGSLIQHTDGSFIQNVDGSLIQNQQIQSVMFSDAASSQPFSLVNPINQSFHIQPSVDNVTTSQPSILIQYALPSSEIVSPQGVPLIQYTQSPLLPPVSDNAINNTIAKDAVFSSQNKSFLNDPNTQHVIITQKDPGSESENQADVLSNQVFSIDQSSMSDQPEKRPTFFIQGGNAQNNQLLQQVLAMWSGGDALPQQKPLIVDTKKQCDTTTTETPQKCSLCLQPLKRPTLVDTSTQTGEFSLSSPEIQSHKKLQIADVQDDNTDSNSINFSECNTESADIQISEPIGPIMPQNDDSNSLGITESLIEAPLSSEHSLVEVPMSDIVDDSYSEDRSVEYPDHPTRLTPIEPVVKRRKLTLMKVGLSELNCKHCDERFKRLGDLMSHVKSTHPEYSNIDDNDGKLSVSFTVQKSEHAYMCEVCQKNFDNFYRLRLHCQSHPKSHQVHKCFICDLIFPTDDILHNHLNTYHESSRLSCEKCGETFTNENALNTHVCYFTPVLSFPCSDTKCSETFTTQLERDTHLVNVHDISPKPEQCHPVYKCPQCKYTSASLSQMERHNRVHSGEKPFACKICPAKFTFKHILKRHIQRHTAGKQHQCPQCSKLYSDARSLKLHIAQRHSKQPEFVCNICDKSFICSSSLSVHKLKHDPNYVPNTYICNYCGKVFTNKNSLITHNRLHTGERPFTCDVCKRGFIEARTLRLHMLKHTGEKRHQCTECGKRYMRVEALKVHTRTHNTDLQFKCPTCNKHCTTTQALKSHMRLHTGEKPYMCEICAKSFPSASSLVKHTYRHSDIRPFSCTTCGKSFKEKYVLQVHARTHSDTNPYKCEICQQTFRQVSTLNVHRRRHTGEKPYSCPECDMTFSTSSSRKRHARIHNDSRPYACSVCDTKFRLGHSLKAHVLRHHNPPGPAVGELGVEIADTPLTIQL